MEGLAVGMTILGNVRDDVARFDSRGSGNRFHRSNHCYPLIESWSRKLLCALTMYFFVKVLTSHQDSPLWLFPDGRIHINDKTFSFSSSIVNVVWSRDTQNTILNFNPIKYSFQLTFGPPTSTVTLVVSPLLPTLKLHFIHIDFSLESFNAILTSQKVLSTLREIFWFYTSTYNRAWSWSRSTVL